MECCEVTFVPGMETRLHYVQGILKGFEGTLLELLSLAYALFQASHREHFLTLYIPSMRTLA
jgi:hypothetical protein